MYKKKKQPQMTNSALTYLKNTFLLAGGQYE